MTTVRVCEIFCSIQGESTHAGRLCSFVRLSGCPLDCAWCDTVYARAEGEDVAIDEVVARVVGLGLALVEVTGGEPLAQAGCPALLRALADRGLEVLLETSGALDVSGVDPRVQRIVDVKCPSSGMTARTRWENLTHVRRTDQVKLVLADRADYEYARDVIVSRRLDERCPVLLAPVFGRLDPSRLARWMIDDRLPARLQLQLHKIIWPPDARGV